MAHEKDGYWPGFVDALVNVVIAMVFVVVLLAISASMFGQLTVQFAASRIAAQRLEQQRTAPALGPDAASRHVAPSEPESGDHARSSIRIVVKGDGNGARGSAEGANRPAADASVRVTVRDDGADVVFRKDVVQPVVNSVDAMKEALLPLIPKIQRGRAELRAYVPSDAVSDIRRSAFLRMLVVRNILLEKGVAPDRVSMKLVERGEYADQHRVRLVLQARPASP